MRTLKTMHIGHNYVFIGEIFNYRKHFITTIVTDTVFRHLYHLQVVATKKNNIAPALPILQAEQSPDLPIILSPFRCNKWIMAILIDRTFNTTIL